MMLTNSENAIEEIIMITRIFEENIKDVDDRFIISTLESNWQNWLTFKKENDESSNSCYRYWILVISDIAEEYENSRMFRELLYGSDYDRALYELIIRSDYPRIVALHASFPGVVEGSVFFTHMVKWNVFLANEEKYKYFYKSVDDLPVRHKKENEDYLPF